MPKLIAILTLFCTWYFLSAQPSNSSFIHYTTDQGMSNDHITSICKDKLGFLWIGTVNGLNRFDGRTFKVFRHDINNKNSIPAEDIAGITLAPDGWLWVATSEGLCKIDPVWLDIQQIHFPENDDTIDNDVITKVEFDSKGMAWTTGKNGMYKINPVSNKVETFIETELPTLGWYGMMIDHLDRLWLMKDYLIRFDPATQKFRTFKGVNSDRPFHALSIVEDDSKQIWAGTWTNGIQKFNDKSDEFETVPFPESLAMMLLPDVTSAGKYFFWVGGGQSGLALYFPDTKNYVEFKPIPEDPYSHNNYLATHFFKDPSSGDVWIGTEVGLEQYAPATIRFGRAMIPADKDMGQFSLVSGVVQDNTDASGERYFIAVWGTGLFEWNKGTGKFTRMISNTRLSSRTNFNLFQDRRGKVWGCMTNWIGLYEPRTKTWKDYEVNFQHKERNNVFQCGLEDRNGNVWFGSNKEGLFRYNAQEDRVESVLFSDEFRDLSGWLNIMGMSEDSMGRLWLACNSVGLVRYNPENHETVKFTYPGQNAPLSCNSVEAAENGRIYASFYADFLELDTEGKILRHYTQQNGLKSNRNYFMVEDLQGKIWLNSVYLLHCYDPVTGTFTYYGKPDGLFSNTITDGLSITPSGEIFVGFQNAFNFFYPDQLKRNPQPPPIAITSIKVMNEERQVIAHSSIFLLNLFSQGKASIEHDTFLKLRPGEDFFEIEFAALNFNQQERNRYAYLLEGFNKDWVFTERPVATFTNLDGGDYTLHMKASNNDGVWNEKGTTLEIHVNPSFYKTRWFPVLITLAFGGIVAVFLWFRRQHRKRLETFRETLARDLHDEMGSTLSSIRFFSEYADQQIGKDKPLVTPMLTRISESATNLSESMQDIIWAMKTDHDQLEDLASHMMEFGLQLCEARNINFKTNISQDISGRQIQPEVRRNIYLIFKEAVNNAAKYSGATLVDFHFTIKKGFLVMKVSDNGKGFDPDDYSASGSGYGMRNMQNSAADTGGKLEIFSKPNEGTTVELQVKL